MIPGNKYKSHFSDEIKTSKKNKKKDKFKKESKHRHTLNDKINSRVKSTPASSDMINESSPPFDVKTSVYPLINDNFNNITFEKIANNSSPTDNYGNFEDLFSNYVQW